MPLDELGPADAEQNGLDVALGAEGLNRGSLAHSRMSDVEEFLTAGATVNNSGGTELVEPREVAAGLTSFELAPVLSCVVHAAPSASGFPPHGRGC